MTKRILSLLLALLLLLPIAGRLAADEKGETKALEGKHDRRSEGRHEGRPGGGHERPSNGEHGRRSEEEHERHSEEKSSLAGEVATQSLLEFFAQFFLAGLMSQAGESPGDMYARLHAQESPALPTIRIEPSYQYLIGGQHGFSGKAEAGYLLFGVNGEYLRYFAKSPSTDLSVASGHFLLRTMLGEMIGADLALGVKSLFGAKSHTGFDWGIPFYIFFGKHFIFDVQPYWAIIHGHDVYDLDSGLSFKYKFIGIRAGYRALFVGDSTTLHGPKVGLFLQW